MFHRSRSVILGEQSWVSVMGRPYIPGALSKRYQQLPPARRDAVNREVNKIFAERTGFTGKLDPKRHKDLVGIWLRIRDEVVSGAAALPTRTFLQLDGFKGLSKDPRHRGWIDVLSAGFGSRPPQLSGQRSPGIPNSLTVVVDEKANPGDVSTLAAAVADGRVFLSGILQFASSQQVVSLKMRGVRIISLDMVQRAASVTIQYSSVQWESQ